LGAELAGMVSGRDGTETEMASELTLTVNGANHVVSAAPQTPLLYVLRNDLKLTGPRLGCGLGQCGACAVLVDGKEVRACIAPVSSAVGKHVTTIEGLAAGGTLHPVQQAWIDEQVPQCGYCQSGMLMAAAALLERKPKPSDADIDEAMTNICRCGTYQRVRLAIKRAARTKA
jgi:isoquinoline 1-oxidoreductase subunit alpha